MRNPFGIAIYEDQVYWIDRQLMTLSSANKFTGEISREIHLGTTPMSMSIIGLFPEPLHYDVVNYCDVFPSCSHHCLPSPASPTNFTCACPPMAYLDTDGSTCLCDNGKLLLSDGEGCQKEPIHVRGLTSGYLADHGLNFDMRCTVSEDEGVICTPRGAIKEATVADPEGWYECRAPRN
ncbi:low-density lipoprotein receptor-related protein 4-like [Patiria miniata]|uniref:Uncharacterized protein n=1 Tax=Patiria miniata TaxID=46514 RepID=A0A913ZBX1_PATMI|nr:low-density lipoprotein receptor-related protein 4-like [Patiria miniata]